MEAYNSTDRIVNPAPCRHGQDGQSGAISLWAEWAARCHVAIGRMGSSVPCHHGQDGQSDAISLWAGWAVLCHVAMGRMVNLRHAIRLFHAVHAIRLSHTDYAIRLFLCASLAIDIYRRLYSWKSSLSQIFTD